MPLASDMDVRLLKDLYGNTSSTILGLPSQPQSSQQLKNVNRVMNDNASVTGQPSQEGTKLTWCLLGRLKTKLGERINIIQQVAPYWKDFATFLDFDVIRMEIIDTKHHRDPEACCREVMQMWLRGMGRQPATFELLEEILDDCNLTVLAMQVKEAIPYTV